MHFEIYQQEPGLLSAGLSHADFRWRLVTNGKTIADSGEGYRNRSDCLHGIELVRGTSSATEVVDKTPSKGLLSPNSIAASVGIRAGL